MICQWNADESALIRNGRDSGKKLIKEMTFKNGSNSETPLISWLVICLRLSRFLKYLQSFWNGHVNHFGGTVTITCSYHINAAPILINKAVQSRPTAAVAGDNNKLELGQELFLISWLKFFMAASGGGNQSRKCADTFGGWQVGCTKMSK